MICVSFLICCDNLHCQTFITLGSWSDAESVRHMFSLLHLWLQRGSFYNMNTNSRYFLLLIVFNYNNLKLHQYYI